MHGLTGMRRITIYALMAVCAPAKSAEVRQGGAKACDERVLARRVELPRFENTCMANAASLGLAAAHLPAGIVQASPCAEQEGHSYAFPSPVSVRDFMDAIIASDPSYSWCLEGGVVNLVPRSKGPAILDTHISDFDSGNATALPAAAGLLLRLPEVRKAMKHLGFEEGFNSLQGPRAIPRAGSVPKGSVPRLNVKVKDIPLRGALNAIVREHGHGVWIYEEYRSSGRRYFRISFVGE